MTHKPGHKTHPHYDALPWETKMRYDKAMEGGDPTKKKNRKTENNKVNDDGPLRE